MGLVTLLTAVTIAIALWRSSSVLLIGLLAC